MRLLLTALALTAASPAVASPVMVGLIDSGDISPRDTSTVRVTTIETVDHPDSFKHADVMVDVIDESVSEKVEVLYISAFEEDPEAKYRNESILNYQVAYRGMLKLKEAGVKYVCTAFDGKDISGSQDLLSFAQKLGLVLVTSMGNDDIDTPYPAILGGSVAVLAKEYRFLPNRSEAFKQRINYVESGVVNSKTRGTSYAAARVCGQLASNQRKLS